MIPPVRVFPINAGLIFNGNRVTDHNRSDITVTSARIENRKRMADGTERVFHTATKRSFKVSWTNVPRTDRKTVDGFWGTDSLRNFYNSQTQEFTVRLTYGDNTYEDIKVLFGTDASFKLNSRSQYTDLWDIDLDFEEV